MQEKDAKHEDTGLLGFNNSIALQKYKNGGMLP
jgi:hypothetical protein